MTKRIYMIAGPNGAGKTTTVQSLMPDILALDEFLNADEIARGMAPMHPESVPLAASKVLIQRFKELISQGESFAFETTAAGKNYAKHLEQARQNGFAIHLFFIWLASPQLAIERVARRVKEGGHMIPQETIHRRYALGVKNLFDLYLPLAHEAVVIDNSDREPKMIAWKGQHDHLEVANSTHWKRMEGQHA